jgi:hypothetical protein
MKYYLIALLLIIMAAGASTMFEIAHHALGREHEFGPEADTRRLIYLTLWFVAMMMATVILLRNKELKHRNLYIALLSAGVLVPAIYQFTSL